MPRFKKLLFWIFTPLILLLLLPTLIPTSKWIPAVQHLAEQELQQSVLIKQLSIGLLPRPYIEIQGIQIANPKIVEVESVTVKPMIMPLLKGNVVVSSVVIENPTLTLEAISFAQQYLSKSSSSESETTLALQQVSVRHARFLHPSINLPWVDVDAKLENKNQLTYANLTFQDDTWKGDLRVNVSSISQGFQANISGNQLRLPGPIPLHIKSVNALAMLENSKVKLTLNEVGLYNGVATGEFGLMINNIFNLDGEIHVKRLSVGDALKDMTGQSKITGTLDSDIAIHAKAKEIAQLVDVMQASGPFSINNGIIHGVDLLKLASFIITKSDGNGNTEFETLKGKIHVNGTHYNLNELNIQSGLIHADGHVSIHQSALDGLVKVEVKKSASLVGVPLAVSGTLNAPSISPTKSAMAGAALGTAVLGPGVGTSVGIKVGDKLNQLKEGLFGKKEK